MGTSFLQKSDAAKVQTLRRVGRQISSLADLEPLIEQLGTSRMVMLGEASHGTHEFYTYRSYISQRLIKDFGFNFIAVEGDWPACYAVNNFIKHRPGTPEIATEVLQAFDRWPAWMWANWEMVALTSWLRRHNDSLAAPTQVGFYGLDVYSLWDSLQSVRDYLAHTDPTALQQAEKAFRCFAPYRDDESSYAYASQLVPKRCEDEVVKLLEQMRQKGQLQQDGNEAIFNAEQNALIAVNAEKYYRAMVAGGSNSWNVRDSHMAETLDRLLHFHGPDAKAIVWAHNTHIGDARATTMHDDGMHNIGSLVRQAYPPEQIALVGFGTYSGSVIAGSSWGADQTVMDVPEAREGSWEWLLHQAGGNSLLLSEDLQQTDFATARIGHRAIGVVYRPLYEQYGNYVPSTIPNRYNAFIFLDETRALHPLHGEAHNQKIPDTYPFGL
ncbi:erythromycin esterase family protein [Pseudocnuella soli]|uniref:erythromycin esterase family protein n=1 Tax=Pseudocnuella soli TaxID=2502779 RepID=UPI0010498FA7|nr:erythromycin esterase family protein [Pseudocnuella soli]